MSESEGGKMAGADEGEGTGKDFHEAATNAWNDAKNKGNTKGRYEIKKIFVETENPIREYRVIIKKT
jgi:hypothetical protein